ncbi:hypothetical protein ILYODFUR_020696 [Ilyodon furcidens]|uniref:Uncharacterized protein n=1 Tax=Ilyodon furcidens TaxID=33524 RepID=A0ABV0U8W4_9TELE
MTFPMFSIPLSLSASINTEVHGIKTKLDQEQKLQLKHFYGQDHGPTGSTSFIQVSTAGLKLSPSDEHQVFSMFWNYPGTTKA